jgi:hypothetical protein
VPHFVSHDAQAFSFGAALDLEHLPAFEPDQSRMSKIERDGEARDLVGREPIFGQPDVGFEAQAARIQLFVKPRHNPLQSRAGDLQRQVAQTQIEQLLV